LESIYNNPDPNCIEARQLYREVLTDASTDDELLQNLQELESSSQELKEKLCSGPSKGLDLPEGFWIKFDSLCQLMKGQNTNGTRAPKRLVETAQTNVFPGKSLLPRWVNLFFIYASSLIYCISRLTILALALSSLRSMPEGVYITTWTQNIPAVH
jgi:hypothetical protein